LVKALGWVGVDEDGGTGAAVDPTVSGIGGLTVDDVCGGGAGTEVETTDDAVDGRIVVDTASTARAAAVGEPSAVGFSVTCERTLPTAAPAITTETMVALIHAIESPSPRLIPIVSPGIVDIELTAG